MHSCTLKTSNDLSVVAHALRAQYPFLLDSAAPGPLGKYSLLMRSAGQQLCLHANGEISGPGEGSSFLQRLEGWYQQEKSSAAAASGWPFTGGWFVYLGYELAAEIEPVVDFPAAEDGFPVAFACRCPAVIYALPQQPGIFHLVAENELLLGDMLDELRE
ncbi:MAG: hypothetical protein HKP21_11905, partial [Xanthomonadales bacterium]|nr:hypothetical protein [Gammaproteobacteria bacterium]NNK05251.1 hypothetical protein [Xanthomonadales bacterium]